MESPYQLDLVQQKVFTCLASVVGVDPGDIHADIRLSEDLGADSLDYVELRALLENRLGIWLPTQSVLEHAVRLSGDSERFVKAGRLTEAGAYVLRQSLFSFSSDQVSAGMRESDILECMTAANWLALCFHLTQSLPEQCPECGHAKASFGRQGQLMCAGCSAPLPVPDGDEVMAAQLTTVLGTAGPI